MTSLSVNLLWRGWLGCPTTHLPRTVSVLEWKILHPSKPQSLITLNKWSPHLPSKFLQSNSAHLRDEWAWTPSIFKPKTQTKMPQRPEVDEQRGPGMTQPGAVGQWQTRKHMILLKVLESKGFLNMLTNQKVCRLCACLLPCLGLCLVLQENGWKGKGVCNPEQTVHHGPNKTDVPLSHYPLWANQIQTALFETWQVNINTLRDQMRIETGDYFQSGKTEHWRQLRSLLLRIVLVLYLVSPSFI